MSGILYVENFKTPAFMRLAGDFATSIARIYPGKGRKKRNSMSLCDETCLQNETRAKVLRPSPCRKTICELSRYLPLAEPPPEPLELVPLVVEGVANGRALRSS